ncbi:hypothetical protein HYV89_00865 [Candidatus Woesearchaeota archaeon]|nr:hypothetical protein [Candidatus Woesearchaeota archaeon]
MEHPIVAKILKEGINSVDLSMLDISKENQIWNFVGEKLYKLNKVPEAVTILEKTSNFDKLKEMGDELLMQNKAELAALCFIPTKDKERLNNVAVLCMKALNHKLAAEAYRAADNIDMAEFLEDNYCI